MNIKRESLIQSLEQFAVEGNGIIIGKPGVGKTHSIEELMKVFKDKGIPYLFLPIDQLGAGTDEDLRNLLFFEGDLISKLLEEIEKMQKTPGVILFDAFDASRNEEVRDRYVNLIARIIVELSGLWNVIVTVRTYDALKSEKLLKLFGGTSPDDQTLYHNKEVKCRHFMIPILSEDEVKQAVEQITGFDTVYKNASADFKDLLNIPFNLWLIEKILTDSTTIPDMSRVKSEVQLLGLFWKMRIQDKNDSDERESILNRLVKPMIAEHTLSSRKENVYKTEEKETWKKLLSDEIIIEISSSKQRVSFSHNILFDYAVSILVIDDDYDALKQFILDEPSRPVFLRPSLEYYFTRLWSDNPSIFWKIYRKLLLDGEPKLRPFTRLIPPLVIAREAGDVNEFKPFLVLFKTQKDAARKGMLHILQAQFALQLTKDSLWIQFLEMFSAHIHEQFAWDMIKLVSKILDRAQSSGNNDIEEICGRVGRSILSWVWQKRKKNKEWFDRLGAFWVIPLVARTFKTDVSASGKLIEELFNIAKEEDFPISYFHYISDHIEAILPYNLEIVSRIYQYVFGYEEVSQEKTVMGGSIIQLTSTRRQDFQMCQFVLSKQFPAFLKKSPLSAIKTAIHSLTDYIVRKYISGYLKAGVEFDSLLEKFNFRGKEAFFIPDNSAIWDGWHSPYEKSIKIADMVFNFFAELANSGKIHDLGDLLDVFRDEAKMAFFWKRLLKTGAEIPRIFAPLLFEICIAKPIQTENATIHQLGVFLEKASVYFSKEQLQQIEESILKIPGGEIDQERHENLERKRNRLLACIPEKMLTTSESREILEMLKEADQIPQNTPLFSMSTGSREVTDEDWLEQQGINTKDEKNQGLLKLSNQLDNFAAQWAKVSSDSESKQKIFKIAQDAFQELKHEPTADREVANTLWTKLATAAETMSRGKLEHGTGEFRFCREVLLRCSLHEEPIYSEDSEKKATDFMFWSPAPRIEAAQGLVNLAAIKPDDEILSAIEKLALDKVPTVRFQFAAHFYKLYPKSEEYFWRLTEEFAKHEKSITIQDALCVTLWNVNRSDEDRTAKILELVLNSSLDQAVYNVSQDNRVMLLVWLFLTRKNQSAIETMNNILKNSETHPSIFNSLVFEISNYLAPGEIEKQEDVVEMAVEVLKKIMDISLKRIKKYIVVPGNELSEKHKEEISNSYGILEDIVLRLYFHSDKSETKPEDHASDEQLERYYFKIKPLLEKVAFPCSPELVITAHSAYYFMQLLRNVLKFDPKGVIRMAARVALSSKPSGYNLEQLAVQEVVKIVETILADHRNEVKEDDSLNDLLSLLDIFAETGWPEAIQLTWRLDEIFR